MSTKLIGPILQYTCSFVKYRQPITTRHSLFMKEIGLVLVCEATSTGYGVLLDVRTNTSTNLDYVVLVTGEGFDTKTSDTLSNDKTRSKVFPFSFVSTKASSDIVSGSPSLTSLDIDDHKSRIRFNLTIKLDSASGSDGDAKFTGSGTCFEAYEEILSTFEDVTLVGSDGGEVKVKKDLLRLRSAVFASLLSDAEEGTASRHVNHDHDGIDGINELDNVLDDASGHHVLIPGHGHGHVHVIGNETRIEVPDFKRNVLVAFVKFIKTDRIGNASGIAMDLFLIGHRYQVPLLKKVAGKIMINDSNEEDKERVFDLIYQHEVSLLKELYYDKVNQDK